MVFVPQKRGLSHTAFAGFVTRLKAAYTSAGYQAAATLFRQISEAEQLTALQRSVLRSNFSQQVMREQLVPPEGTALQDHEDNPLGIVRPPRKVTRLHR